MTLEQFKTLRPGVQEILLYYTGGNTVQAINVSAEDCNGINLSESLKELVNLTVNINGVQYVLEVLTQNTYVGYYSFTVTDTVIPNITSVNEEICNDTYINPSTALIGFETSDYNATINNVDTGRLTSFIFDVDRSKSSILPINYHTILSGAATPASFQELNHTSIGLTNSRYSGTKTSILDYGVNSGISATPFNAAIYLSSSSDEYICSQSLADRDIQEYLFTGNQEFPISGSRIFTLQGNKVIPVRNRKIWIESNTRVIFVDKDGYAINSGTLCSI